MYAPLYERDSVSLGRKNILNTPIHLDSRVVDVCTAKWHTIYLACLAQEAVAMQRNTTGGVLFPL